MTAPHLRASRYALSVSQLAEFVSNGFVVLQSELPASFHEQVCKDLAAASTTGNFDNNLVPRFPIFQDLLDSDVLRGAVGSLLGEDYLLQPHRHGHTATKERSGVGWHKDSYWGTAKVRRQRPWMCMVMYYPQDTPLTLGPTMVSPGSQTLIKNPLVPDECGEQPYGKFHRHLPTGTILLIDYHLWHSGNVHTGDNPRYMLKFQFSRQALPKPRAMPAFQVPAAPSAEAADGSGAPRHWHPLSLLWGRTWAWLHGQPGIASLGLDAPDARPLATLLADLDAATPTARLAAVHAIAARGAAVADTADVALALAARVNDPREAVALEAAHALATLPIHGIPQLVQAVRTGDDYLARNAAYGLTAAGEAAIAPVAAILRDGSAQSRKYAAATLGDLPCPATGDVMDSLLTAVHDEDVEVRRHALEALGLLGHATEATVDALLDGLRDVDAQARFTASIALGRMATSRLTHRAVPVLVAGFKDENRYVRAYNTEALLRMNDPVAIRAAAHYLSYSRWCPITETGKAF